MKKYYLFLGLISFVTVAYANDFSTEIEAYSERERLVLFTKHLYQSKKSCGAVTRTFLAGLDRENTAYWQVSCVNGISYSIRIPSDPNKNSGIMSCYVLKKWA